jgi:hypothetical protein
VCDLETSRICTPYIYDIRSLRLNDWSWPVWGICNVRSCMEQFLSRRGCDGVSRRPRLPRILGRIRYCYCSIISIYNFSSIYIFSLELPVGTGPKFIFHWAHMGKYIFNIFHQSTSYLPIDPTPWSSREELDLRFFLLPLDYVQPKSRHSAILTIIFISQEANVLYLTHWERGHLNCLNARYRGF